MTIAEFEILLPLIGGLLIGLSATLMLWFNGRIVGVSGIAFSLLSARNLSRDVVWRVLFVFGLILGAGVYHMASGAAFPNTDGSSLFPLIAGGLLVGAGTKLGSGCTSGHGVCGIGRLSIRSLVATITFMVMGVITVFVFRHLTGVI